MSKLRSGFFGALFGVFGFALFSPGPLANQRTAGPGTAVIAQVRSSSVSVVTDIGEGSGVIFHRNGRTYVLTAAHVVDGIPYHGEVTVERQLTSWKGVLVNLDVVRDVALIRLDVNYEIGASASLAERDAPVGTHLLHVGNLLGAYPGSYLEGTLAAKGRPTEEGTLLDQTSIIAWPGSSGGGVFTSDGELVGLIVRGVGPGLNFMVPVAVLREWAVDNDLHWLFQ